MYWGFFLVFGNFMTGAIHLSKVVLRFSKSLVSCRPIPFDDFFFVIFTLIGHS